MVKASLKNYNQTPRKVRLVADFIRGKKAEKAISELNFINKKSSSDIVKLLNSAVSNAVNNFNLDKDSLYIKEVVVDEAIKLKRYRPGARGRAFPYKRRYSTISVTLASEGGSVLKTKEEVKKPKSENTKAKKKTSKKDTEVKEKKKKEESKTVK